MTSSTYHESLQLLFACAKARQPCPQLCEAWTAAALPHLASASAKQLGMALWSLAQLGFNDEAASRAIVRAALGHVSSCAPAFISLVASALGTAGRQEPMLMLALSGEVRARLRQLPPDVVSHPPALRLHLPLWPAARDCRWLLLLLLPAAGGWWWLLPDGGRCLGMAAGEHLCVGHRQDKLLL